MSPANVNSGAAGDGKPCRIGKALVVGAGVSGIRASLDLAEVGYDVLLVDASAAIGGLLAKLDHQFPSDHCGMCRMLPTVGREYASQGCLRETLTHDHIQILPLTRVAGLQGEPGSFEVELITAPRGVDPTICNGCGQCVSVCPVEVADGFNHGLTRRKAIYRPVPHNLPNLLCIDREACNRCGECVKVCPLSVIDPEAGPERRRVVADAVIFAAGTGLFEPRPRGETDPKWDSPNVMTSLEFERWLSASGAHPNASQGLARPSDGNPARRIAWLQCVGSRAHRTGQDYCSGICCMFALKEAVLAKKIGGADTETTIFYMDMRTFGKDHYRYRRRAEDEHGVQLTRCRVHDVLQTADGSLRLTYFNEEKGALERGLYDVVVLSTGQTPSEEHEHLAKLLHAEVSATGRVASRELEKVMSPVDGVLMCGSFMGLTDISEAVVSGSAAASEAAKVMHGLGRSFQKPETPPLDSERLQAPAQVAAVLCLCAAKPSGSAEAPRASTATEVYLSRLKQAMTLRCGSQNVHVVERLCRSDGQKQIEALLLTSTANRLLIGACAPRVYEPALRAMGERAGIHRSLIRVVDVYGPLRGDGGGDGAAIEPERIRATETALGMVEEELRVMDVSLHEPVPIVKSALVVGGGIAGIRAALSLADRGIRVHLVEKTDTLGGWVRRHVFTTLEGRDPARLLNDMHRRATEHELISIHREAEVVESGGTFGQTHSVIRSADGQQRVVRHGATILATGGKEPGAPGNGLPLEEVEPDRVYLQSRLEAALAGDELALGPGAVVVMIQCVGSRQETGRNYCSRVCCAQALKNALALKKRYGDAQILILNRDMTAYGTYERYFTEAREMGIVFAKYKVDQPPSMCGERGRPVVTFEDHVLHRPVSVTADLLVLSTGVEPSRTNRQLAEVFDVPLNADGFFQEADAKWRPVEFNKGGVFVAGMAHSPQSIPEVIVQAEAAAERAFSYLCRDEVIPEVGTATVRHALCCQCRACVAACPYHARGLDLALHRVVVDNAACRACGACAVACQNGAADVSGRGRKQLMAVVEAALEDW